MNNKNWLYKKIVYSLAKGYRFFKDNGISKGKFFAGLAIVVAATSFGIAAGNGAFSSGEQPEQIASTQEISTDVAALGNTDASSESGTVEVSEATSKSSADSMSSAATTSASEATNSSVSTGDDEKTSVDNAYAASSGSSTTVEDKEIAGSSTAATSEDELVEVTAGSSSTVSEDAEVKDPSTLASVNVENSEKATPAKTADNNSLVFALISLIMSLVGMAYFKRKSIEA